MNTNLTVTDVAKQLVSDGTVSTKIAAHSMAVAIAKAGKLAIYTGAGEAKTFKAHSEARWAVAAFKYASK